MMKLILAIIHHTDGEEILRELVASGYGVTRIASSGGFLRRGHATLLVGAEENRVRAAINLIREHSAPPVDPGLKRASIFVLNVERFEQM